MLGCCSFRQILASRSSFWKSERDLVSKLLLNEIITENSCDFVTSWSQFLCVDDFCGKFEACRFLYTSFDYWKCTSGDKKNKKIKFDQKLFSWKYFEILLISWEKLNFFFPFSTFSHHLFFNSSLSLHLLLFMPFMILQLTVKVTIESPKSTVLSLLLFALWAKQGLRPSESGAFFYPLFTTSHNISWHLFTLCLLLHTIGHYNVHQLCVSIGKQKKSHAKWQRITNWETLR